MRNRQEGISIADKLCCEIFKYDYVNSESLGKVECVLGFLPDTEKMLGEVSKSVLGNPS